MSIRSKLFQKLTYWSVSGTDGFGGYTFNTPVVVNGRWEESQQKFISESGEESVTQAVVYLENDVSVGDWLGEGDLTADSDPTTIAGGFRVRGFSRVANLRNTENLRRAFM